MGGAKAIFTFPVLIAQSPPIIQAMSRATINWKKE
jgi:hypothetical protein